MTLFCHPSTVTVSGRPCNKEQSPRERKSANFVHNINFQLPFFLSVPAVPIAPYQSAGMCYMVGPRLREPRLLAPGSSSRNLAPAHLIAQLCATIPQSSIAQLPFHSVSFSLCGRRILSLDRSEGGRRHEHPLHAVLRDHSEEEKGIRKAYRSIGQIRQI